MYTERALEFWAQVWKKSSQIIFCMLKTKSVYTVLKQCKLFYYVFIYKADHTATHESISIIIFRCMKNLSNEWKMLADCSSAQIIKTTKFFKAQMLIVIIITFDIQLLLQTDWNYELKSLNTKKKSSSA